MADTSFQTSPALPDYIPPNQRPSYRPRYNTYIPQGFGYRDLSTTGNVQPTPPAAAPAPSTPAGLRGVFAARAGGMDERGDAFTGGPSSGRVDYDPNMIGFAPGQMSVMGLSTGTGFDKLGQLYDSNIFDPIGFATGLASPFLPGIGALGGIAGKALHTGGVMPGGTMRQDTIFDILRNPQNYSSEQVAAAKQLNAQVQAELISQNPTMGAAQQPAPAGLRGVRVPPSPPQREVNPNSAFGGRPGVESGSQTTGQHPSSFGPGNPPPAPPSPPPNRTPSVAPPAMTPQRQSAPGFTQTSDSASRSGETSWGGDSGGSIGGYSSHEPAGGGHRDNPYG